MPKQTKLTFRIIAGSPSEGIERTLPYSFELKEEAEDLCRILDSALYPRYCHRVETSISHHMSGEPRKEHTYAYHGR